MKTPTHPGIWMYRLNNVPEKLKEWVRVKVNWGDVRKDDEIHHALRFFNDIQGKHLPADCWVDAEWREVEK